ncbi:MAG: Stp1/IreP family PP2C-type Ser/Thr phosphatase [Candidatus Cloacimonetes bacterium]|nr:Stp1/IreP family PP2C-type Ser/Thr phosphatase [Candidatus Cloacimonadota bacterium]
MRLKYASKTDLGKKYDHNEDYFLIPNSKNNIVDLTANRAAHFILCDGMGGAKAGEVASQLCAKQLNKIIEELLPTNHSWRNIGKDVTGKREVKSLNIKIQKAIETTNKNIYELSQKHEQYHGMGTTLVAAVFFENNLLLYSIGDSRCYRLRDRELTQLTEDQSVVWQLYKSGAITKDEIRFHPGNNIITMSLGTTPEIEINSYEFDFRVGDVFLMCSDGLTDIISDTEIRNFLNNRRYIEKTCQQLVTSDLQEGGKDNITVILVEIFE